MIDLGLRDDQARVMARVLAEESAHREHVVVYLSGAHAYGFPSPDSDLDLKAIHLESTRKLLGFAPPVATFDRAEVIDGVEIDYTSNELAHALAGVLQGNGNFIERLLGRLVVYHSGILDDVRPIVTRSLSRHVHKHYRGFAANQRKALEREPTAKKLLYVLRTALTGIHLLDTGELETDLSLLGPRYELGEASELIERKRAGERVVLDADTVDRWRARVDGLFVRLDEARASSVLPEEPPNAAEVEEWLMTIRASRLRITSRS